MGITHCLKRNTNETKPQHDSRTTLAVIDEDAHLYSLRDIVSTDNVIIDYFNTASIYWRKRGKSSYSNSSSDESPNLHKVDVCIDQKTEYMIQDKNKVC